MNDPRVSHDKNMAIKISGLNKKYFPNDYAEQAKYNGYQEARNRPSGNRDIHTASNPKKSGR
jgi:hypothetical protein